MGSNFRFSLLGRQVHCYLRPAPVNLAQSQLVFRELQKFGDIATFYNLRHDYRHNTVPKPSTVLAIFESEESATKAINASPLVVRLPTTEPQQRQAREQSTDTTTGSEPNESDESSTFSEMFCTIRASEHDHEVTARENPYHRSFYPSFHWLEVQDLMHTNGGKTDAVPQVAYADCFSRRKGAMPYRQQAKILYQNEDNGDTSLMGLWRKGRKERGD